MCWCSDCAKHINSLFPENIDLDCPVNVMYKIESSCIAKKILPILIDDDQTGFISNRYIGEKVRLIYDLINYLNKKQITRIVAVPRFRKSVRMKNVVSFRLRISECLILIGINDSIKTERVFDFRLTSGETISVQMQTGK